MEDSELRRIEKTAGVEPVGLDEITPALAAIGKIDAAIRGAEIAIGGINRSGRLCNALAGARGGHDDETRLAAVLGRRRATDNLDGLNGIGRKLVGEDLALLVGDRLTVDRERVGGVIAQAMEKAVGICSNAGGGFSDQRTERGRGALERHLLEQVAVHVHVECRIVFNQVAAGFDRDGLAASGNLQNQLDFDSNGGTNLDSLRSSAQSLWRRR